MPDNEIPPHLKCDHLFLLVGTNPLPNWVAARLLARSGAQVHLICTPDVPEQTRRLRDVLQSDHLSIDSTEVDGADERKIYDAVRKLAEDARKKLETAWKEGKECSVGLNYTGGTKMMSVHAHHALRDAFAGLPRERQPIFSYLNAGDLEMKFDSISGQQPVPVSQATEICLSAELLFDLHGDLKKSSLEKEVKGETAAHGLAVIHSHEAGQEVWRKWFRNLKDSKFSQQFCLPAESQFQKDIEERLNSSTKKLNPRAHAELVKTMLAGYQQVLTGFSVKENSTLAEVVQQPASEFSEVKALTNWFNGLWLEHHTLAQLRKCEGVTWNKGGLATNLRATSEDGRDFQADVTALRGYQIYYFSCFAGSDPKTTKLKLFEALVRATQLGGDEARAAVVSGVEKYDVVRQQAEADWERVRTRGQFEVFGREHLPNLAEHISEWVNRRK